MRKIPLFFTLLLMGAWVYTSWYWYTCNIKWLCDGLVRYQTVIPAQSGSTDISGGQETSLSGSQETSSETLEWDFQNNLTGSWADTLSSWDVLTASPEREDNSAEEAWEEDTTSTGSLLEELSWENNEVEDEVSSDTGPVASICSVPLVWPIGIGNENNENEVRRLEAFLNTQGESLPVNGVYEQNDVAAVNRFQTKYRAQILDPWGINNPTWYVFRTTVSTMNSVACGEDVSLSSESTVSSEDQEQTTTGEDDISQEQEETSPEEVNQNSSSEI